MRKMPRINGLLTLVLKPAVVVYICKFFDTCMWLSVWCFYFRSFNPFICLGFHFFFHDLSFSHSWLLGFQGIYCRGINYSLCLIEFFPAVPIFAGAVPC